MNKRQRKKAKQYTPFTAIGTMGKLKMSHVRKFETRVDSPTALALVSGMSINVKEGMFTFEGKVVSVVPNYMVPGMWDICFEYYVEITHVRAIDLPWEL